MSLQVWLPLDGDLHNQGLNPITFSDQYNNLSINNNGKIGQCYEFDTSDTKIIRSDGTISLTNVNGISLAGWFKINDLTANQVLCGFGKTGAGSTLIRVMYDSASSSIKIWANGYKNFSHVLDTNWHHYAIIYDKTNIILYIDGIYIDKKTTSITLDDLRRLYISGTFNSGDGYTAQTLNGLVNDFRFYDHALSPKEVEEIAKGLVLHYKLDNNGMGGENLFSLDTVITASSKTIVTVNNNIINVKSSGINYGAFIQQSSNRITFESGITYILSGHIKSITKGEDNYNPILTIRNSSNNNIQKRLTVSGNESDVQGTYTPSSTFEGYISGLVSSSSGSTNTIVAEAEFSNIKLEKGITKTSWSPTLTDSIYPADYKTTIYDSSGYSHNGTIVGSLTAAAGSPRYDVATDFDETYPRISSSSTLTNIDQLTISLWVKTNQSGYPIMFWQNGYNKYRFWLSNKYFYFRNYSDADGDAKTVLIGDWQNGNWNHVVITYDKGTVIGYLNGIKTNTKTSATSEFLSGFTSFRIGQDSEGSYPFVGQQSDLRLYTTALTADQVKELYNTSMSVDSNGNVYARELVEL